MLRYKYCILKYYYYLEVMDIKKEKKAMDIVHNSYYGIVIAMALKNIMSLGMDLKRSQM